MSTTLQITSSEVTIKTRSEFENLQNCPILHVYVNVRFQKNQKKTHITPAPKIQAGLSNFSCTERRREGEGVHYRKYIDNIS